MFSVCFFQFFFVFVFVFFFRFFFVLVFVSDRIHAALHFCIFDIIDNVDSHQCVAQFFSRFSRKVCCALDTDTRQTW